LCNKGADIKTDIDIGRLVDSLYLSLGNAALLDRAVILKRTRRRERGIGDRRIEGKGFGEGEIGELDC
jgi:hypothetical protein